MKFKNWLNAVDEDEEDDSVMDTTTSSTHEPTSAPPKRSRSNLILHGNAEGGMEIRHPHSLEERNAIGADLKQRRMVTLDLSQLPDGDARYFLEFVYGVVFALDATVENVHEEIYLLAPRGISVRNDKVDAPVKPSYSSSRTSGLGRGEHEEKFWQGI
jgi:FtsZ-interacting cell division protein YlmF